MQPLHSVPVSLSPADPSSRPYEYLLSPPLIPELSAMYVGDRKEKGKKRERVRGRGEERKEKEN